MSESTDSPAGAPEFVSGSASPDESSRAADRWIAHRIRDTGYDLHHPQIQVYADHLYDCAVGTLFGLHKSGKLFAACRRLTHGALPATPATWAAEAHRVISETVCTAMERFITESVPRWDPEQSSLTTYFVNFCLIRFKNHYKRFCREEALADVERPVESVIDFQQARDRVQASAEEIALAKSMHDEITRHVGDPQFTRYLHLALNGRNRREIATELGMSESTLSRKVNRWQEIVKAGGWPSGEED